MVPSFLSSLQVMALPKKSPFFHCVYTGAVCLTAGGVDNSWCSGAPPFLA